MVSDSAPNRDLIGGTAANELASQRTAMAFERTALASDRTLMAMVRTSLALIGFGFTIFQFFHKLSDQFLADGLPAEAPRRFGFALIVLGVILLCSGLYNHDHATRERRRRRQGLFEAGLIRHPETVRPNGAKIVAILLLIVGLVAMLRVGLRIGPF